MNEPRAHKYGWGQCVVADVDLFNDGSHPQHIKDALLVESGTKGEVTQVGMHVDTNTPVYLVEFFGGCVVGCLEEEIGLA